RISLTGFRSCASRSQIGASQSRQSTEQQQVFLTAYVLRPSFCLEKAYVKEITVPNEVTDPVLRFLNPASQCHTCGAKDYRTCKGHIGLINFPFTASWRVHRPGTIYAGPYLPNIPGSMKLLGGKQLDKEEYQEIGSFDAFRVLMTQFLTFINFRYYFDDDEGLMIRKAKHKRENDKKMSDRMMQSKERKDNSSKALDVGLVVTESNETESERHVLSSRSGNDTHTDDADINSINDKQPMAEV
nr:DNA-directed RNA polymerase IV subunit 1 isoform X1 [Tanacetum cinerariifolium]